MGTTANRDAFNVPIPNRGPHQGQVLSDADKFRRDYPDGIPGVDPDKIKNYDKELFKGLIEGKFHTDFRTGEPSPLQLPPAGDTQKTYADTSLGVVGGKVLDTLEFAGNTLGEMTARTNEEFSRQRNAAATGLGFEPGSQAHRTARLALGGPLGVPLDFLNSLGASATPESLKFKDAVARSTFQLPYDQLNEEQKEIVDDNPKVKSFVSEQAHSIMQGNPISKRELQLFNVRSLDDFIAWTNIAENRPLMQRIGNEVANPLSWVPAGAAVRGAARAGQSIWTGANLLRPDRIRNTADLIAENLRGMRKTRELTEQTKAKWNAQEGRYVNPDGSTELGAGSINKPGVEFNPNNPEHMRQLDDEVREQIKINASDDAELADIARGVKTPKGKVYKPTKYTHGMVNTIPGYHGPIMRSMPTPARINAVRNIIQVLGEAKEQNFSNQVIRQQETRKRSAKGRAILEETSTNRNYPGGEASVAIYKSQFAGRMVDRGFTQLQKMMKPDDMTHVREAILYSPGATEYDRLAAEGAFTSLMEGELPPPSGVRKLIELLQPYDESASTLLSKIENLRDPEVMTGWKRLLSLWNIPRGILSSIDFSAPLRQGLVATSGHPLAAARGTVQMFLATFNEKKAIQYYESIINDPLYLLASSQDVGLYISGKNDILLQREEDFMSHYVTKALNIPVGPLKHIPGPFFKEGDKINLNPVAASERAYVTYLNKLRWDIWKSNANRLLKGKTKSSMVTRTNPVTKEEYTEGAYDEKTMKELRDLAHFVNIATGRSDVKLPDTLNAIATGGFFSPRFLLSKPQTLTQAAQAAPVIGDTLGALRYVPGLNRIKAIQRYRTMNPGLRMMIWKDAAAAIGVSYGLLSLAKVALESRGINHELYLNPTGTNANKFGQLRIYVEPNFNEETQRFERGGYSSIDLTGGMATFMRDMIRLKTGETREDVRGASDLDRGDSLLRYLWGKSHPTGNFITNILVGKDIVGEPHSRLDDPLGDIGKDAARGLLVPMMISDARDAMEVHGGLSGAFHAIPAIFGATVNSYQGHAAARDVVAQRIFGTDYFDIPDTNASGGAGNKLLNMQQVDSDPWVQQVKNEEQIRRQENSEADQAQSPRERRERMETIGEYNVDRAGIMNERLIEGNYIKTDPVTGEQVIDYGVIEGRLINPGKGRGLRELVKNEKAEKSIIFSGLIAPLAVKDDTDDKEYLVEVFREEYQNIEMHVLPGSGQDDRERFDWAQENIIRKAAEVGITETQLNAKSPKAYGKYDWPVGHLIRQFDADQEILEPYKDIMYDDNFSTDERRNHLGMLFASEPEVEEAVHRWAYSLPDGMYPADVEEEMKNYMKDMDEAARIEGIREDTERLRDRLRQREMEGNIEGIGPGDLNLGP